MIINKVWGHENIIVNKKDYCGKILYLKKGYKCSLHKHKLKHETFYIDYGTVYFELGTKNYIIKAGGKISIPRNTYHRFTGIEDSKIIEFSTQHYDKDSYRKEFSCKCQKD